VFKHLILGTPKKKKTVTKGRRRRRMWIISAVRFKPLIYGKYATVKIHAIK
jgi:hypothetical protein